MLVLFSHFGYNEINIHTYILIVYALTATPLLEKTSEPVCSKLTPCYAKKSVLIVNRN